MKRKKTKRPEPAIKQMADRMQKLADIADTLHSIRQTKAMLLRVAWEGGASIESLAEKLCWKPERLYAALDSDDDVDLRTLSDIATAMNREIHVKVVSWPTRSDHEQGE